MCSTLSKFKSNIFSDILFTNVQDPVIVKRSGIIIRLTANHNQFNTLKIPLDVNAFNQRLCSNIFMLNRQCLKYSELFVCIFLVFNCATNNYIIVPIIPILWDTFHKPFYTLCKKQKSAILPLLNHFPAPQESADRWLPGS